MQSRGSSRRCCPGATLQRMFFLYPSPFPAFGRGKRGYTCQRAEAPARADLRQRVISPTTQRRAVQLVAGGVSQHPAPRAAPATLRAGRSWLDSKAAQTFPWSNLEEDEAEQETWSKMRMKSSLCIWRAHLHSTSAENKKLSLASG